MASFFISSSAFADVNWAWSFTDDYLGMFSPTQDVVAQATLTNLSTSTELLAASDGIVGLSGTGLSNAILDGQVAFDYQGGFGIVEPFPWPVFIDDFFGTILAPGESKTFDFIYLTPVFSDGARPGDWSAEASISYTNNDVIETISNSVTWTVSDEGDSDPSTIPSEGRVGGALVSGSEEFPIGYDWTFSDKELRFYMEIALVGDLDVAAEKKSIFENGISEVWSGHSLQQDGKEIPIVFDIDFSIGASESADYEVTVKNEGGRSSALIWYTDVTGLWPSDLSALFAPDDLLGVIAAHELGHLLGLYDEYSGAEVFKPGVDKSKLCTPVLTSNPLDFYGRLINGGEEYCNSLMADNGPVVDRYLIDILNYADEGFTRDFSLLMAPPGPTTNYPGLFAIEEGAVFPSGGNPIPEPASLPMLMAGIIGLALMRLSRKDWRS